MGKVRISENMFRKAIVKTSAFKEFIAQYKERMNTFCSGYYNAVRIEYQFSFDIKIFYHHCDFTDTTEVETYKRCVLFDDTIITNYSFTEKPADVFSKLIVRHILDIFTPKEICHYHVIDKIGIECTWWHINELFAWSSEKVGIYHEEQECGEGWFIMPKEPEVCMRNYIDIR